MLRAQANRVLVVLALVTVLPAMALAERMRRGWGRAVALAAVRGLAVALGIRFEVRGSDQLISGGSWMLVANHSSPLDIPALLVARPDVRFVAAADLFGNRVLAAAMRALGTIEIDRRNARNARRQLAELAAVTEAGRPLCLAVFPEGGIAPRGRRLPFKSGAFLVAIETGATVVPVVITGTADLLPPGGRMAVRAGTVTIELLEPIPTDGMVTRDRKALRDRAEAALAGRPGSS